MNELIQNLKNLGWDESLINHFMTQQYNPIETSGTFDMVTSYYETKNIILNTEESPIWGKISI